MEADCIDGALRAEFPVEADCIDGALSAEFPVEADCIDGALVVRTECSASAGTLGTAE